MIEDTEELAAVSSVSGVTESTWLRKYKMAVGSGLAAFLSIIGVYRGWQSRMRWRTIRHGHRIRREALKARLDVSR